MLSEPWQALKVSLIIFQQPPNFARGLCLNGHNRCYIYQNVCLSRRRKADLENSRIGIHTLESLTILWPKNLTKHLQCNLSITCAELKQIFKAR
jgi:hypothetical protein